MCYCQVCLTLSTQMSELISKLSDIEIVIAIFVFSIIMQLSVNMSIIQQILRCTPCDFENMLANLNFCALQLLQQAYRTLQLYRLCHNLSASLSLSLCYSWFSCCCIRNRRYPMVLPNRKPAIKFYHYDIYVNKEGVLTDAYEFLL